MRKFFTLVILGTFGLGVVGCKAEVDSTSDRNIEPGTTVTKKKTTVTEPDGDRTTRTEVRTTDR